MFNSFRYKLNQTKINKLWFFCSFVILLLVSCEENKEEVVDLDSITVNSTNYKEDSIEVNNNNILHKKINFLSDLSKKWIDTFQYDLNLVSKLDSTFFNDRFGAKHNEKWYYKNLNDSLVFMHWEFQDSIKAINAFFNWIDCFGKNCFSFKIGDKVKLSKRSLVFLLQNNHLFFIESSKKQNIESYLLFFDNMKWEFHWKFIMYQANSSKTKWFKRNEENKELIEFGN